MSDAAGILKKIAPWIGAAATGGVPALVGMAAAQIGAAFGKDIEASTGAIAQAVAGATPEQMLELKKHDAEFKLKMQALGFSHVESLEKIAADDRASARTMHAATRDWVTPFLATIISVCFFSSIYLLLSESVTVQPEMRDVAMMLLGTLAASFTQVLGFYFGTSASSKEKTGILKELGMERMNS